MIDVESPLETKPETTECQTSPALPSGWTTCATLSIAQSWGAPPTLPLAYCSLHLWSKGVPPATMPDYTCCRSSSQTLLLCVESDVPMFAAGIVLFSASSGAYQAALTGAGHEEGASNTGKPHLNASAFFICKTSQRVCFIFMAWYPCPKSSS